MIWLLFLHFSLFWQDLLKQTLWKKRVKIGARRLYNTNTSYVATDGATLCWLFIFSHDYHNFIALTSEYPLERIMSDAIFVFTQRQPNQATERYIRREQIQFNIP